MRKFARFAALSLSAIALGIGALPLFAADLREVKDPKQIARVFAPEARIRVLNVWATWCIPCVLEMPDLRAIDAAFDVEVSIVGVSLDDMLPDGKQDKTRAFLEKQQVAFPNVYYTGNADDLGEMLKFDGEIPITIVYDRNGKELWRHTGRIDRDKTIARLREALTRRTK
jgi:thiol-disulfide isomerase/thioredoxin